MSGQMYAVRGGVIQVPPEDVSPLSLRAFLWDHTWIDHFDQRCPICLSRDQLLRCFL
jgi:hypothetical protein